MYFFTFFFYLELNVVSLGEFHFCNNEIGGELTLSINTISEVVLSRIVILQQVRATQKLMKLIIHRLFQSKTLSQAAGDFSPDFYIW